MVRRVGRTAVDRLADGVDLMCILHSGRSDGVYLICIPILPQSKQTSVDEQHNNRPSKKTTVDNTI